MSLNLTVKEKKFGNQWIFKDVELTFPEEGLVLLVGENGCGKSTLLNMLALMDDKYKGQYFWLGNDLKPLSANQKSQIRADDISYIMQKNNLVSYLSVKENINLRNSKFNQDDKRQIQMLSQGQQEMIAVERELQPGKRLYLMDEITANLDPANVDLVVARLMELSEHALVIVVSHDKDFWPLADFIYKVERGKILQIKAGKVGSEDTIRHKETERLEKISAGKVFQKRSYRNIVTYFFSLVLFTVTLILGWIGISLTEIDAYPELFKQAKNMSFVVATLTERERFEEIKKMYPENSFLQSTNFVVYSSDVPDDHKIHISSASKEYYADYFEGMKYKYSSSEVLIDETIPFGLGMIHDSNVNQLRSEETSFALPFENNYWGVKGMSGYKTFQTYARIPTNLLLVNVKFLKEMVDPKFSMSLDDDCFYVNNADYCTTEKVHFDYSPSLYLYDDTNIDMNEVFPDGVHVKYFSCDKINNSYLTHILVSDNTMDRYRQFYREKEKVVFSLNETNRQSILRFISNHNLEVSSVKIYDGSFFKYSSMVNGKRYLPNIVTYGGFKYSAVVLLALFTSLISYHLLVKHKRDDTILKLMGYSSVSRYLMDIIPLLIVTIIAIGLGIFLAALSLAYVNQMIQLGWLSVVIWSFVFVFSVAFSHFVIYLTNTKRIRI